MAWGWSTTRYSPIAVDFGADSLKLLQIIPSDPPQMVAAASMDLPEHARANHAARHAFFSDSLKELLSSRSFKGRRAICSIPAYQTLVQHIQIQGSSDPDEFEAQLHQHLRQRLNVDPSRMIIRHFNVGQVIRDGVSKQEVICLAASRDATLSHIQTAQRAKLEVVGMHCEPLAILQAFSHLYRRDIDNKRVTCFVDLGAATTKIMISHGILMAFAKTIHVAGDHFTRQVAETHDISFSQARQLRIQEISAPEGQFPREEVAHEDQPAGVEVTGHATEMMNLESLSSGGAAAASGKSMVKTGSDGQPTGPFDLGESMECLLDEMQMCMRYHKSTFPEYEIEKLVFLGGESRHVDICQRIAKTLRIGAQLGDPLARLIRVNLDKRSLGVDMRHPQPGWAVPMGLCLSDANL